ncbi:MAG: type VI secretion system Vgr family protein [Planctomycetota bacterium]
MSYTQTQRFCSFQSPLGENALLLRRMQAREGVSSLFEARLLVESERADLDPHDLLGKPAAVRIETQDGGKRWFHGLVSGFEQHGRTTDLCYYQVELRPWPWMLTRRADCRIFQNMSAPKIVEQVFREAGFGDFELRLQGTYKDRTYCVQYRETDLAFVTRLLEEEGIFFFFEHEENRHQLVLTDGSSSLPDCEGHGDVDYMPAEDAQIDRDVVTEWLAVRELHPGKQALKDFNFEDPGNPLLVTTSTGDPIGDNGKFEIFDYHPGEFGNSGDGDGLAKVRMQELESLGVKMMGRGTCRGFSAGHRFGLQGHFRSRDNQQYMLTQVHHSVSQPSPRSDGDELSSYENTFTCVPTSLRFRPARTTQKPFVRGPQTAVVVGPSGEEIWVDKYGRVKVQFHWDRQGKRDDNSSCWIRVSQAWAGKQWGAMAHPRIGDEVIVECLEGDPDQPIITGTVYNARQMPPYDLEQKDNWTRTGIVTRSSPGGADANFNEIRFDDKKGEEQLYFHAEKNHDTEVENDQSTQIGHDQRITVQKDRSLQVGENERQEIGKDRTVSVGENHDESIGKSRSLTVGKDQSTTIAEAMTVSVGKSASITIGESRTLDVGKDSTVNVGGSRTTAIAKTESVQAKKVQIVASDELSLVVGSASIVMKKNGDIQIKGKKIDIKGSSDVVVKGSKVAMN